MSFNAGTSEITITLSDNVAEDVYDGQTYYTVRGIPWAECIMCNHVAPEDQMGRIDGKPYCYRYDCFDEALDRRASNRKE